MAMTAFEIFGMLKLDTSEFDQELEKTAKGTTSVGGAIGSGLATAAKVGVAAVGAATTAAVGFGATAVKAGSQFDQAMGGVAATMGVTMDEMADQYGTATLTMDGQTKEFSGTLREFAKFMGQNTVFSATQAAGALNYMALAGYNTQESMDMLPTVLNMAAAGSMDLAQASDMVTDTQKALGLDFERTAQMADEFAKAASTGNTDVQMLGEAFLRVGGLARELNGGFITLADGTKLERDNVQELEIAFTAMADAGVKGAEAGTHMRNMLLKLSSPTEKGGMAMQALAVDVFDAEGRMRSLKDIYGDLINNMNDYRPVLKNLRSEMENLSDIDIVERMKELRTVFEGQGENLFEGEDLEAYAAGLDKIEQKLSETGQISQEAKIGAISELFNTRDLASAEALLNSIGSDWDRIGESISQADGSAAQMSETKLDNLLGDMTLFQSALESAQIAINDKLSPTLRDFVKFGTQGVQDLTAAFNEGGLEGMMTQLGTTLSDGLSMIFDKAPGLLNAGMNLLGALGQGIIDNLPQVIEMGTKIIDTLLQGLSSAFTPMATAGMQIIGGLVNAIVSNAPALLQAAMEAIAAFATGLGEALPTLIPTIVGALMDLATIFVDNIDIIIQAALVIIQGLAEGLTAALPVLFEKLPVLLQAILQAILENIAVIIEAGIEIILALVNGIIDAIPSLVAAIPQIITAIILALANSAPTIVESGMDLLINLGKGLMDAVPSLLMLVPQIIMALAESFYSMGQQLQDIGFRIIMEISEAVKSKISEAMTWGKDLIDNFINGIKSKWEALKSTIGMIAGSIKKYLGFSEPEEGPLSNFHTYAPDMMQLFAQGIKDNEGVVTKQLSDSFDFGTFPQMEVAGVGSVGYNEVDGGDSGSDIVTAITDALMNMQLVVNIGNRPIEAMITNATQRTNYRNGGR